METVLYILMLFVTLGCVFRLSMWGWWQRAAYSTALAAFVWYAQRWAVEQSKTQLADYLQNTAALQNMAIVITVESMVAFAYIFGNRRLRWAPPLLMFPVAFYVLTQVIFANAGVSFNLSALLVAGSLWVGLPLLAGGVRWLLPEEDFRTEVLLLLTVLLCVLGLLSTQNGTLIYTNENQNAIMELISKVLFGIANSLLVPDIVLLIFFFVRAIVMVVSTYNASVTRRRSGGSKLYAQYLAQLREGKDKGPAYADWLVSKFEIEAQKDVNASRTLTKLGPVLGLVGTLISMSPALVGLSAGDISGMAYNMQVVFATTVVGLLISSVGLVTQQLKQRWYAADLNNLDYEAKTI